MSKETLKLQSEKLWIGNLDLRVTEYQLLQILQKYGEIQHFNFVYHTAGANIGQPKGFAFVKYANAEDTINVLTKLNNKKIGNKNIAVRYAKHIEIEDDGKSSKVKIPALGTGSASSSKASLADKKSKIQLIEEQLKNLSKASDEFELNTERTLSEPLIKKYQFNKDAKPTTSTNRYNTYYKKKRKPY